MATRKRTLTVGQIARFCHVSHRTVQKWFDTDLLSGFLLPGTRNRRVHIKEFKAFIKHHGMPIEDFLEEYGDLL